jgi:hypothetical protein
MGYRASWLALGTGVVCAVALACGSGDGGSTYDPNAGGSSGSSGDGTSNGGLGGSSGTPTNAPLTVEPPTATITISSRTTPATQSFVAKSGGVPVSAGWVLDSYASGAIDTKGLFTSSGITGGKTKVKATYNAHEATADLTVLVKISEDLAAPPSAANKAALDAPNPDPNGSQIVYPLDGTVMPRGLTSPTLQFTPGTVPPEDAKITLSCSTFSWTGYGHVPAAGTPQMIVPQDVWDAFTQSCGGETATITVTKAAGGQAFGPVTIKLTIAATTLKGAVFYQTYDGAAGGPTFGLWSVRPGVKAPATHLISSCVVCHSVSANGATLVVGADPSVVTLSGAYKANLDGTINQISAAPAVLNGDTRGISFSFLPPDGTYALRSTSNFWGGVATRAFKVDPAGTSTSVLPEATVVGLANVPAFVPTFAPDGKHIAFVNGDGATTGSARESLSIMDATVDPAAGPNGTLTFSNQTVVLDNGLTGGSQLITKYPTFLPDTTQIVLQEGTDTQLGYGGMLAWYNDANTGKLFIVRGTEHIELAKVNANVVAGEENRNYEPFALPVQAGGYFWIVFTSRRSYGNTYTGAAVRKQLWVAAIDPKTGAGVDPGHPPFYLPNQSDTANDRGFWALEPCKANGTSCDTSDQCCGGSCSPMDPSKPTVKTCGVPTAGACRQTDEKCDDADPCCTGLTCLAGSCAPSVQ